MCFVFQVQPGRFSPGSEVTVCLGKEWHRFPTSFFLPDKDWNAKFLRSEFRGQLPQPYIEPEEGGLKEATRAVRESFNDLNKQEENRCVSREYFKNLKILISMEWFKMKDDVQVMLEIA